MMMINFYPISPSMSSIGAVCDSFGKTFLLLLVDNLGATGGLRLNSSPVKVKPIIFPLFLHKGNAILQKFNSPVLLILSQIGFFNAFLA